VRESPDQIFAWDTFPNDVLNYWIQRPQGDKDALVAVASSVSSRYNVYGGVESRNESHVKFALEQLPIQLHLSATSSNDGQPRPTDYHSILGAYEGGWGFIGQPDYFFICNRPGFRGITGVMDAKKPWSVTPQEIRDLFNGIHTLWEC
jgi:hypothetical protein